MKPLAALAIAVVVLITVACGGAQPQPANAPPPSDPGQGSANAGSAPSCDDVVVHVKQLSIAASGATSEEQKDQAAQEVEPALVELADECEAGWSETFRRCVIVAKSREDVAVCDKVNAGRSGSPQ